MKEASIIDMIAEEERLNREKEEARKLMHSCYECSNGIAEHVILEGSDIPYQERDRIIIVHDMVCKCADPNAEAYTKHGPRMACRLGEAEYRGIKCSKCVYGKHAFDATHISSTNNMKVIHELYTCSAPRHVRGRRKHGEFYRGYCRCDQFKKKEN